MLAAHSMSAGFLVAEAITRTDPEAQTVNVYVKDDAGNVLKLIFQPGAIPGLVAGLQLQHYQSLQPPRPNAGVLLR